VPDLYRQALTGCATYRIAHDSLTIAAHGTSSHFGAQAPIVQVDSRGMQRGASRQPVGQPGFRVDH
jgi:hypothetical protein